MPISTQSVELPGIHNGRKRSSPVRTRAGLIARGVVSAAESIAKKADVVRQTPRVSITVKYIEAAKRSLGRSELKRFTDWKDGRPETELNFKFYRQATNKIVSVSDHTAAFLDQFF